MSKARLVMKGRTVLVTGASAGLGAAMALELANAYGAHVFAVARRAAALEALSEAANGAITPLVCDMTAPEADEKIKDALNGRDLAAAILNAGVTDYCRFTDQSAQSVENMLALNVAAATRLAQLLLPDIIAAQGGLMLVSSLGGLIPLPYQAVYSGTKAHLAHFGLALAEELRTTGASVTVLAPGGIATEMTAGTAFDAQRDFLAPAQDVAREGLRGLARRKTLVIPGWQNKAMSLAARFAPRALVMRLLARQFKAALP